MHENHRLQMMEGMLKKIHRQHRISLPELKATCDDFLREGQAPVTKSRRKSVELRIKEAVDAATSKLGRRGPA